MKSQINENKKNRLLCLSRNLLMLLVAVLGTSAMVHAFPAKAEKATSAKEVTMKKHHKHHKAKKEQKAATATTPATPAPSSPKTK